VPSYLRADDRRVQLACGSPDARAALDHDLERFLTETDARIPARPSLNGELEYLLFTARKA
jgi:hypothetical protein